MVLNLPEQRLKGDWLPSVPEDEMMHRFCPYFACPPHKILLRSFFGPHLVTWVSISHSGKLISAKAAKLFC